VAGGAGDPAQGPVPGDRGDRAVSGMRVGSVVLGVSDVRRAMAFWTRALDYVPRDEPDETWVVLRPASGDGPNISLGLSETPVQEKPRVHLDLYTDSQTAEVERLVGIGASRVD